MSSFGQGWTDNIFKPKYKINLIYQGEGMFYGSLITELNSTHSSGLIFDRATARMPQAFRYSNMKKILVKIDGSSSTYDLAFSSIFEGC
ncbi:hypothetical protein [Massilibacteroides sp.]|uniref:hypothetical protein n=1 Tax=Massilibacteroides sp. TaxID=2034766 RepID=UPI0026318919|nr:hypothetical protein [Massilibacteroides sp.]MDD4516336.1 hypothetical protein [Massilibacteroides sp.]